MVDDRAGDRRGVSNDLVALEGAYNEATAEFLHLEYEHLGSALLTNEEGGEKRVNILFALIAAVAAGLGLGADAASASVPPWLAATAAAALLVFGLFTLRRMMGRNIHTTELINGLRRIRGAFLWTHPEALDAVPFTPKPSPEVRKRKGWWLGRAGFLEIVAVTNCLLVGAAVFVSLSDIDAEERWVAAIVAIAAATILWWVQIAWAKHVYRTQQDETSRSQSEALYWWIEALNTRRDP